MRENEMLLASKCMSEFELDLKVKVHLTNSKQEVF